ncbi:hypothetical protein ACQF4J_45740 [Streptomyces sp. C1-1]|uniref:hypothetical protein n=1 Tax=Streptomyces sp. C1-1 TaxID=3231173 RepID=UPI003D08909B
MARQESQQWLETSIAGLQIRTHGVGGMRVLGWEGFLPLSVIPAVTADGASTATPATPPLRLPPQSADSRPQPPRRRRPSPTPQRADRNAEKIRDILRRTGCTEFSVTEDGFVVDGGDDDSAPLLVACTIDHAASAQRELQRYRKALTAAGIQVGRHGEYPVTLLVRMQRGMA